MVLKLYNVTDSPPCTAVRMALKYLKLEHELIPVDMEKGEHQSEDFLTKNPQGQVPVLEDNGFFLSESVAILQYLADKYKQDESFYPADLQKRAKVNHRLAFHLSTLYAAIGNYYISPLFTGAPQTEDNLAKLNRAMNAFEGILRKQNTNYVAGNEVTIADLSLVMDIVCCQGFGLGKYDLSPYPLVAEWYGEFQKTEIWIVAKECLDEITAFVTANNNDS